MINQIENALFELRKIKTKINRNIHRHNVSGIKSKTQVGRDIEFKRISINGFPCESLTFGTFENRFKKKNEGRIAPSVWNNRYPEIYQEILDLSLYIIPENFNTKNTMNITLNKNLKCLPHIDNQNTGLSIIIGLGNYTGGRLILHHTETDLEYINIHNKPYIFDGTKIKHSTEDFIGERYSIIFYNTNLSSSVFI